MITINHRVNCDKPTNVICSRVSKQILTLIYTNKNLDKMPFDFGVWKIKYKNK